MRWRVCLKRLQTLWILKGVGEVGKEKGKCQGGRRIVTFQVCATSENPWVAFDQLFCQWGHQIVNSTLS